MLAVEVKNIKKTFQTKQATVEAVKDVSFEVKKGSERPRQDSNLRHQV